MPRDVVATHQRTRLLSAAADAVAEQDYATLAVRHIVERAGVSRATFYEQFEDLRDCVVAAYGDALERLVQAVSGACASQRDWPEGVAAAVNAGLEFATSAPAQARLLVIGSGGVDQRLARLGLAASDQLAGLLRRGRERSPEAIALPDLVEHALIGGVISIVGTRLIDGKADRLQELKPELVELLLTPYLGDQDARRFALAS